MARKIRRSSLLGAIHLLRMFDSHNVDFIYSWWFREQFVSVLFEGSSDFAIEVCFSVLPQRSITSGKIFSSVVYYRLNLFQY